MKQLILGVALVACVAACKSSQNTSVADPNPASMPKKECSAGPCSEKAKMECGEAKMECSTEKKASCCPSQKPQG